MSSTERFGYEWEKYSTIDPNYETQFKNWITPFKLEDFKNKDVLDAGCGMGRNSYWPLKTGAKSLIAFDYDKRSVEAAKKNLKDFNNAQVIFKSIYEIDWSEQFDIGFSIGVIHHLEDPELALKNIVKSLRPGGTLIVWVYSYEGNEWIVKLINPIRKAFTSKLPIGLVHLVSYLFSVPLWFLIKIFKGPSGYLKQISKFKFHHVHSIVFDQLLPGVANYWRKEEVSKLISKLGLTEFNIYQPPNKSGWTVIGKK